MNALLRICSLVAAFIFVMMAVTPHPSIANVNAEPEVYAQDDQHALVLPGTVRIIYHIKGTFYVDPFSVNVRTLEVTSRQGRPKEESLDTHLSGTGFSISEDGLFATNAHVVTPDQGRYALLLQALFEEMFRDGYNTILQYGPNSRQAKEFEAALEALEEMDDNDPRVTKMQDALLSFARFVDEGSTVYVVPQGATSTSFMRLTESGYKVDEVFAPNEWVLSGRDVALLRIANAAEITVPALALASSTMEGINTPVSAYGFPGSTDLSADSLTSVTVTQGRITSLKTIPAKEKFDMYQIDAKISSGSSGGPMVDQQGRVLGLITATTVLGEGDKFGFAVPVHILFDLLEEQGSPELRTEYQKTLRNAYALKEERKCKRANKAFLEAVALLGASSGVGTAPIQKHVDACDELIAAGLSVDSPFDAFKERIRSVSALTWSIIGAGFVLVIGALFAGLLLMRELSKSRAEVEQLEHDRDTLTEDTQEHPLLSHIKEPNLYPLTAPPPPPPSRPSAVHATQPPVPKEHPLAHTAVDYAKPSIPIPPTPKPPTPAPPAPRAPAEVDKPVASGNYNAKDGDDVYEQGEVVAVITHRPTYTPGGDSDKA